MNVFLSLAVVLFGLSSLTACREREIGRSTSQEILINDLVRTITCTLSPGR